MKDSFATRRESMLVTAILLSLSSQVLGGPLIDTHGNLEINWSSMLVRFTGQAQPLPEDGNTFKPIERRAWQDALASVGPQLSALKDALPGVREDAAALVRANSQSKNTTYFSSGRVQVLLESPMSKIFADDAIGDAALPTVTEASATGVILAVSKATRPVAIWTLRGEGGRELFGPTMVPRATWERNLMGRWFRRPGRPEVAAYVGNNPIQLEVVPGGTPGEFVLKSNLPEEQENMMRHLMATGRVVLAVR